MNTAVCCPPSRAPAAASLAIGPATLRRPFAPTWPPAAGHGSSGVPSGAGVQAAPVAASPSIRLHRLPWQRAWASLNERWHAWRDAVRQRAALRALAAMDRRTLRDVGLDEFVPEAPALNYLDMERARW